MNIKEQLQRLIIMLVLTFGITMAQTYNTDIEKLSTYAFGKEDIGIKISLNENSELQFVKVIDSLDGDKDKLFTTLLSYFAYYYKDAKNVLQQQDKENGIIIGKGHFPTFSSYSNSTNYLLNTIIYSLYYSANHTIRTDIKDNKIRIIMTISDYSISCSPDLYYLCVDTKKIIDCEPFAPNYKQYEYFRIGGLKPAPKLMNFYIQTLKKAEPQAFIALCKTVNTNFLKIEESLRKGNIKVEKDEW